MGGFVRARCAPGRSVGGARILVRVRAGAYKQDDVSVNIEAWGCVGMCVPGLCAVVLVPMWACAHIRRVHVCLGFLASKHVRVGECVREVVCV